MNQRSRRHVWLAVSIVLVGFVLAPGGAPFRIGGAPHPWISNLTVVRAHIDTNFVDGEVIGEIVTGVNVEDVAERHHLRILEDLEDDWFLFGLPEGGTVVGAISELGTDPDILSAEPNFLLQAPEVAQRSIIFICGQSSSDYHVQDALQLVRAREAQAVTEGGWATVAVIDTGIDPSHSVFSRVGRGFDFVDDDSDPVEEVGGIAFGHGTMVAGIIALVAPGAAIMPVRAFGPDGIGSASDVSQAIRYAAKQGAHIINMSFGMSAKSGPIRSALNFAEQHGAMLIASAGNNNSGVPQYPADDSRVMAVGATDAADFKAGFSNYGSYIAVSAPGVGITGPFPGGDYARAEGTSFAAAFVSGEAALVRSVGAVNSERVIRGSAVNIDPFNPSFRGRLGSGRIDMLAAVTGKPGDNKK